MNRNLLLACLALTFVAGRAQTGVPRTGAAVRMCKASDLSLGTDDENGSFNGMSHSGTLLVLRNLSPTACRVPQRPEITFLSKNSRLPVTLVIPGAKYMHPGPVLVPVVVAPDAGVTSKLRWVSGEVYSNSACVTADALSVAVGGESQSVAAGAHLCGDKAKGITFEATPLITDPVFSTR